MFSDYGYDTTDGTFHAPQILILNDTQTEISSLQGFYNDLQEISGAARNGEITVGEELERVNAPGTVNVTYQGTVTLGGQDMMVVTNGSLTFAVVPPLVDASGFVGQTVAINALPFTMPAAVTPSPVEILNTAAAYRIADGQYLGDTITTAILGNNPPPYTIATDDGVLSVGDVATIYANDHTATVTFQGSTQLGGELGFVMQLAGVDGDSIEFVMFPESPTDLSGTVLTRPLNTDDQTLCFAQGTQISTPCGTRAVEHLAVGDMILTADGATVAVLWVGQRRLHRMLRAADSQLVRIRAGALGNGLPSADLTVTADHGMVIDGYVINASALVNGTTIDFVPMAKLETQFTVYHIETEAHDVILANGAPSETFVDVVTRSHFDNYDEYLALYGTERIIMEMNRSRITTSRLVPQSIKDRLGTSTDKQLTAAA